MADAADSKSAGAQASCRFESDLGHQSNRGMQIAIVLAIAALGCPATPEAPQHDVKSIRSVSEATGGKAGHTPILITSPDPVKKEVERIRALGFNGQILVRTNINANGKPTRCAVEGELSFEHKRSICHADASRRFRPGKASTLVESFPSPALR